MPLVKKEETLVLNTKIPRKLHDEIDEVKQLAQEKGMVYDYTEAVVAALEKDIRAVRKDLKKPAPQPERTAE